MGFKSASIGAARRKGQKHNKKRDKKKVKREVSAKICSGMTVRVSLREDVENKWAMYHNYPVDREKAAGICYFSDHPGLLTQGDIKRHNCIGKGCRTFKPFLDHATWQKPAPRVNSTAPAESNETTIAAVKDSEDFTGVTGIVDLTETQPLILKAETEPDNIIPPAAPRMPPEALDTFSHTGDTLSPENTAEVTTEPPQGTQGELAEDIENAEALEADRFSRELADKIYRNILKATDSHFKEKERIRQLKEERERIKAEHRRQNEEAHQRKLREKAKKAEKKEREEKEEKLKKSVLGNQELYPGRTLGGRKARYTQKKINGRAYTYKQGGAIVNKKAAAKRKNERLAKRTEEKLSYEYNDFLDGTNND